MYVQAQAKSFVSISHLMENCLQLVDMTKRLLKALVLKSVLYLVYSLFSWIPEFINQLVNKPIKTWKKKWNLYDVFRLYVVFDISSNYFTMQAILWYTNILEQKTAFGMVPLLRNCFSRFRIYIQSNDHPHDKYIAFFPIYEVLEIRGYKDVFGYFSLRLCT